jgi:hypothetical protein
MLRKIFTDLKGAYATPYANQNRSGTHVADFWRFCNGNKEVLYLYEMIVGKDCQDIHTIFANSLPEGMEMESNNAVVASKPQVSTFKDAAKETARKKARLDGLAEAFDRAATKLMEPYGSVAKQDEMYESINAGRS